jgi:hypothetical protein
VGDVCVEGGINDLINDIVQKRYEYILYLKKNTQIPPLIFSRIK